MICKNCGASVADDGGTFCPECGKRLDGKTACPKCKKLVDANSTFCTFCGAKILGSVSHGENRSPREQDVAPCNREETTVFEKIENFISPSLILLSTLILFICGFFIFGKISIKGTGISLAYFATLLEDTSSTIDYLKYVFDSLDMLSIDSFGGILKTVFIFNATVLILNLVIIFIMLACEIIFFTIRAINKKEIKIHGFGYVAFISFIVTVCCFASTTSLFLSYTESKTSASGSVGLSGGAKVGLIFSAILIGAVLILKCVKNYKSQDFKTFLAKTVTCGTILLLSAVALTLISGTLCKITMTEKSSAYSEYSTSRSISKIKFSAGLLLFLCGYMISDIGGQEVVSDSTVGGLFALWIIQIAAILLICALIFITLKNLSSEKLGKAATLVISVATSFVTVVYAIVSAIVCKGLTSKNGLFAVFSSSSTATVNVSVISPIIAAVLCAIALVCAMVYAVIATEKHDYYEY